MSKAFLPKLKSIGLFILVWILITLQSSAQTGVSITTTNSTAVDPSALLDLNNQQLSNVNNKGLLLPRVTSTSVVTTPVATGLIVYQTNAPAGIYYYTGTSWILLSANGGALTTYFQTGSQTFTSSGTFTIPAGITQVKVYVAGAGGGGNSSYIIEGGAGGFVSGILAVTPGQSLTIAVGTGGADKTGATTSNGGGGSSIKLGSTILCAAGGGGGASGTNYNNVNGNAYIGLGGGQTFGTSIAGPAGTTNNTYSNIASQNYIGYLSSASSGAGYGAQQNINNPWIDGLNPQAYTGVGNYGYAGPGTPSSPLPGGNGVVIIYY